MLSGVCGAGKSAVGAAVADRLGVPFIDADDLHPAANKAKMARGLPLDDADRSPWLDAVAGAAAAGASVVACSALRRRYRERLLEGVPNAFFVELDVSRAELERRVRQRSHEFMSPDLLDSQLATLQPLASDEPGLRVAADDPLTDVVRAVLDQLQAHERGEHSSGR
nr:gluconokinase, GntK/IdnK-type [Modestobacter excelsi]